MSRSMRLCAAGGVPAAVHHALLDWARSEAARRIPPPPASGWRRAYATRRRPRLREHVIRLRLDRLFDTLGIDAESADCPYKGLAPFDEQDAATFFGREQLVGELAARSVGFGLLALLGVSGSGKSSVVQAGLLPSLAAGSVAASAGRTSCSAPGSIRSPARSCSSSPLLRGTGSCSSSTSSEDVFTICDDESERSTFVTRLVELADAPEANIVVTHDPRRLLRSLRGVPQAGRPARREPRPRVADDAGRAGPGQRAPRTAFGHPAGAGARRCARRRRGRAGGSLPSSPARSELWRTRDAGWISYESYVRTGGISGAVARLAEESFSQLDGQQREAARAVLLRLAGGEDGDTLTRRRVPRPVPRTSNRTRTRQLLCAVHRTTGC